MIVTVDQPAPRSGERYFEKMRLMQVAEKMTRHGWLVERSRIEQHRRDALERVGKYTEVFLKASGLKREALGPAGEGKTAAIRSHFLEELSCPVVSRAKGTGNAQVNSAALVEWATKNRELTYAPQAAALYAIRKNRKLSEFCGTYLEFSKDDGRIHFEYNCLGTQTGRWTSSTRRRIWVEGKSRDPRYRKEGAERQGRVRKKISCNAQQIPKKVVAFDFGAGPENLTASLRDCFLADPGCVLLRADYDQLELRLIAYLAGVKRLIQALKDGTDIHCLTAAHLFREMGLSIVRDKSNTLAENAREAAKTCAYAIAYQHSTPGKMGKYVTLHKSLAERFPGIGERDVERLVTRFFKLYPEIQSSHAATKHMIDTHGYIELPINGRRLYYPATPKGYNQGLNFPKQGTGGALCDRALIEIDDGLQWDCQQQVRGQVHDEIICHARFDDAERVAKLMEKAMSRPAQIGETYAGIPAAADPGLDWGACMEWDKFTWPTAP